MGWPLQELLASQPNVAETKFLCKVLATNPGLLKCFAIALPVSYAPDLEFPLDLFGIREAQAHTAILDQSW